MPDKGKEAGGLLSFFPFHVSGPMPLLPEKFAEAIPSDFRAKSAAAGKAGYCIVFPDAVGAPHAITGQPVGSEQAVNKAGAATYRFRCLRNRQHLGI